MFTDYAIGYVCQNKREKAIDFSNKLYPIVRDVRDFSRR